MLLRFLMIALFPIVAGTALGCNKSESESESHGHPHEGASTDTPQTEAQLDAVLASIDGVEITVREFQDRINRQSPYIRARYTSNDQKKEFLDNLIRFEVLAQQAKSEGFDKNSDVIRTMKQVMIQKLMKEHFETGITPDDVKEEQMRAYYDANPAEFNKPEEIRVSAIVVDTKIEADKAAKLALGEKGSTNKGFRELVAEYSTDQESKPRGGDLRYFTRETTSDSGALPKELIEAAFGLTKTGDVVGPIKGSNGKFYIAKQTGHRKAINKTFEQVKRQLQNRLYRDMRSKAQKDFVQTLKAKAEIEIFEDKLGEVLVDTSGGDGHDHHAPAPDKAHSEATHEAH